MLLVYKPVPRAALNPQAPWDRRRFPSLGPKPGAGGVVEIKLSPRLSSKIYCYKFARRHYVC